MTTIPLPKILLVGTGNMAREYAKVLMIMKKEFLVVGRGEKNALEFEKITGQKAVAGGLKHYLETGFPLGNPVSKWKVSKAIVAVNEEQLGPIARLLIQHGAESLLLEKPGGINLADLKRTERLTDKSKTKVFIAYNRRFYASTLKAKEFIKKDGGVTSFTFDFTERSRLIEKSDKTVAVKKAWLLANSSHIIDLAFFLGGQPNQIRSYAAGGLKWHPSASIYAGAGQSEKGALFSYHANWQSGGRWSLEIMTLQRKLIFRPLEKLRMQKIGSMTVEEVPLNNRLDAKFKPGLYRLTQSFLADQNNLTTITEQTKNIKYYKIIDSHV